MNLRRLTLVHEMSGNEEVFRFKEGSVLFLVVISDGGANLELINDTIVLLLLHRSSSIFFLGELGRSRTEALEGVFFERCKRDVGSNDDVRSYQPLYRRTVPFVFVFIISESGKA